MLWKSFKHRFCMWETNANRRTKDSETLFKVCKQSVPGFPGYVPVDLDLARCVPANCMTVLQTLGEPSGPQPVDVNI